MNYRRFGKTNLEVSEIGFGAWAIGGGAMIGDTAIGWGKSDDEVSLQAIHAALDAGINFFDTADIYGFGHSEELLGKTLHKEKDIVIATKVGNVSRSGNFTVDYSRAYIVSACEASLRRLKRNEIDYYQLHSARTQQLEEGECIAAMEELKRQGKIRYWGMSLNSFEPAPEALFLMERQAGNGFQLVLNMLNQLALSLCREASQKGYGIIARMPLQFGLLTGKFDNTTLFDKDDHRKNRLTPALIEASQKALQPAWALCSKYGCSKAALALSFILSNPEVSVAIPGIRTKQQVRENTSQIFTLEAGDRSMLEALFVEEWKEVFGMIKERQ
jgi:aryl-alcohol dehydrogenase-like predicted oxidoreductase